MHYPSIAADGKRSFDGARVRGPRFMGIQRDFLRADRARPRCDSINHVTRMPHLLMHPVQTKKLRRTFQRDALKMF
jgi:hypothetical protein